MKKYLTEFHSLETKCIHIILYSYYIIIISFVLSTYDYNGKTDYPWTKKTRKGHRKGTHVGVAQREGWRARNHTAVKRFFLSNNC